MNLQVQRSINFSMSPKFGITITQLNHYNMQFTTNPSKYLHNWPDFTHIKFRISKLMTSWGILPAIETNFFSPNRNCFCVNKVFIISDYVQDTQAGMQVSYLWQVFQ